MRKYAVFAAIILGLALSGCSRIVSNVMKTDTRGYDRMVVEKNVMVPMRDSVRLATDIYRPRPEGKYPTVLCRLPYGSDNNMFKMLGKIFVSQGYVFLVQDTRGTYSSDGAYFPLLSEFDDGHDAVDWVYKQRWFNGKLGMWGGSYFGYTQWEAAVDNPKIAAMVPMVTSGSMREIIFRGGATEYASFTPWNTDMQNAWNKKKGINQVVTFDLAGGGYFNDPVRDAKAMSAQDIFTNPDLLPKGMEVFNIHPGDIADMPALNFDPFLPRVSAPSLLLAGWYDVFIGPQLEDFTRIRAEGKGDARMTRIIVGPWVHGAPGIPNNKIFHQGLLDGIKLFAPEMMAWYEHWLKGANNGAEKAAPLKIFVMGENVWRDENEWPLARTKWTDFYIHGGGKANSIKGDGKLDTAMPGSESADKFTYDPSNPAPTIGGNFLAYDKWKPGAFDQALAEKRKDVLLYVTEPLKDALEVTGPVKMVLYAQSDAKDTDFTAKLVDIWPDGKSYNICDGIIRARYRDGYAKPTLIEPGKTYKYEIDLWATSNVFKPGHRIGLEISSSNFPRFDRNSNCGGEGGKDCRKTAHQVILHDPANPSHLVLPVIPR